MHPYTLYNDEIVRSTDPVLRPGQIGLLSGWGVFTTLRIYDGIPFAFERHWQRMSRDGELLHVPVWQDPETVEADLLRLVEANDAFESSLRLCIFRSEGGFWAGPGSGNPSDLVALTNDLPQWKGSVALSVVENACYAASPLGGAKTLSWAHNLTLLESAQNEGFDEVILLNESGEVAECTSANIFAVKDGTTYTPPLSSGALPGVTRAVMLEELDLANAPVAEKVLRLEDLYEADEVFITSTTRELLPAHRVLDRKLSRGVKGAWPVMEKLQAALREYIQSYVEERKRTLAPVE